MSPIPLISNIIKKMSLEHAKTRTIGDGASVHRPDTPTATGPEGEADKGYDTLIGQLVSLVEVAGKLLEEKGVQHQIRAVWDGFSNKPLKDHLSPTTPGGARAFGMGDIPTHPGMEKTREIVLTEGLVNIMKRVAAIVDEDDFSDIEEDDHVIWTHHHGRSRYPKEPEEGDSKPPTPTARTPKVDKTAPPPAPAPVPRSQPSQPVKSSKQRLEEAKAVYKAEKARYRAERELKRRDKLTSKGWMLPEPNEIGEDDEDAVPITSAPPGRRTSLMSAPDPNPRVRSRIEPSEKPHRTGSSIKPSAGSTYSPALLPARLSHSAAPGSIIKAPLTASPTRHHAIDEATADAGSEGPGTPKPPPRPARSSTQFDFDAFMEANAWAPKGSPGCGLEQPASPNHGHFPTNARPSITTGAHLSMNPPPRVYMQTSNVMDSPAIFETASIGEQVDNTSIPPTPPPRPRIFSPTHSATPPPTRGASGLEAALTEAFRANPTPRTSLKRNRWGDGMGGRRMDVGSSAPMRNDSMTAVEALAHPPPVYSTDGEGGDDVLETGGPVRPAKGMLPLHEEFKRRCLTILHEVRVHPGVAIFYGADFVQYNATRDRYPNLDYLIGQGIQAVNTSREAARLAAESNPQARETFLSEEVPNVVNRVLATIQRGSTPNYV
ncbi:hypothetical protein M408DRAFT_157576 [Serendipita vermifera MAFF 305830]|uniref:Uncharacterized protein n=1 Tax=Serendipita vermifera MAFF 305830 TaxID=933852 RepID=A0A0C3BNG1_SERVB|nr:hypothetical protein M408DRAFT_157576 [Serendipita vermifera MAFF 305830]